jgi:RHS repeat-associated protein
MPKTSTRDTTSKVPLYLSELHMYGSSRLGIWSRNVNMDVLPTGGGTVPLLGTAGIDTFNRGNKFFELANHLGNVLVTVSDRKLGQSPVNNLYTSFTADVVSATDYAPFGMQMVGRSFDAAGSMAYRYGFNGKENDSEVKGEGNQQDYEKRIYDNRLGRFLSVDPLTNGYPEYSPYHYAENCPIKFIDLDGLESADPKAIPTGISHISKATVPYGIMEETAAYAAGSYLLFRTNSTSGGGDFYTARIVYTDGKYKGMYKDDWIVGPEAVHKFIANAREYEKQSTWIDLGFNLGGTQDFSAEGLVTTAKKTWNPVNIAFGISILGKGIVGIGESNLRPNLRPTWQESEVDILNDNPGFREQVSFKNGKEVPKNTKGSVRPEGFKEGFSIESKNYDVTSTKGQNKLVYDVIKQVRRRAANLPQGTHQTIVLDFRGLKFNSSAEMMTTFMKLKSRISTLAGSQNVTVGLKR